MTKAVSGIPSAADAVAATVALGRRLGLPVAQPQIIAEGYSVRVRLSPAPVVSRVVTAGRILRGDPLPCRPPWLRREVGVARYLAAQAAAVVAPWEQPGPFLVDGLEVSLWTWVDQQPGTVSARDFAAMLFELHAGLSAYPGALPTLVGPLTDIHSALTRSDDPVLHAAAATLLPLASSWPRRPRHGDAHTGNILLTAGEPLWTDFEDVCVGPLEWDLASSTVTDEAVAAYPGAIDPDRLRDCRDLRRLQTLAGVLTDDVQDGRLYGKLVSALRGRC